MHDAPRDLGVVAGLERHPVAVAHHPEPAGGDVEELGAILVVVRRRAGNTRRCRDLKRDDPTGAGQWGDSVADDPHRAQSGGLVGDSVHDAATPLRDFVLRRDLVS